MINPEKRYQQLINTMMQRGSRMTSHRMAIARLLSISEGHPNVVSLFENLRINFPTISLATVYKTLSLLKEEGEVLEIKLKDDSHFDGNKPFPHPHLVCTKCKRIFDGDEVTRVLDLEKQIDEKYQFRILHHQIVFYGICKDCQSP